MTQKQKTIVGFKKAQSLISKIIKMLEADDYCIDVMQQNLAAIGLLRAAHQALMENHLNTCFRSAMVSNNGKKKKKMAEEILKVANLFNK